MQLKVKTRKSAIFFAHSSLLAHIQTKDLVDKGVVVRYLSTQKNAGAVREAQCCQPAQPSKPTTSSAQTQGVSRLDTDGRFQSLKLQTALH